VSFGVENNWDLKYFSQVILKKSEIIGLEMPFSGWDVKIPWNGFVILNTSPKNLPLIRVIIG
jgi:hypothetical protein